MKCITSYNTLKDVTRIISCTSNNKKKLVINLENYMNVTQITNNKLLYMVLNFLNTYLNNFFKHLKNGQNKRK